MSYYLSYIEIEGHAALMLSEQAKPSEPARIVCNVGFGPARITEGGNVAEELNADVAIFSPKYKVVHRTYEISQAEMEKFFSIINREKRVNASTVQQGAQVKHIGGPDYDYVRFNCKTFAMGVLKEMGITDAENLSNFLVQRPGTTDNLLKPMTRRELSCPLKEEILPVIERLDKEIASFAKSLANRKVEPKTKAQLLKNLQEISRCSKGLMQNGSNREYKKVLNERFESLRPFLDFKIFAQHHAELTKDLKCLHEKLNQVDKLLYERQLDFYWKGTPPVAERLNLKNFTAQEKAIYLTKIKTNETVDGLSQIVRELDNKRRDTITSDPNLYSDLTDLEKIILKAKKSVTVIQKELNNTDQKKPGETFRECVKYQKALDGIISNLEDNLSKFTPKTQETSAFMRFINRIVAFFKDQPIIEDECSAVKGQVSIIKQSLAKRSPAFFATVQENQEGSKLSDARAIREKYTKAMATERGKGLEPLSQGGMSFS
ncbi:hypothetical protein [Legionella donaldsonii]|uniref:hypothetical protein n=1 Tax=Legionella donaldsonii TaxID=45060 RepID=UPI00399D512C